MLVSIEIYISTGTKFLAKNGYDMTVSFCPCIRANVPVPIFVITLKHYCECSIQFEKLSPFDGTMAYAQNKRQQVVMTEQWAKVKHNLKESYHIF
jgi:hypothetical protein